MSGKKNLHEGNILYFTLKVCKKTGTKKRKKRKKDYGGFHQRDILKILKGNSHLSQKMAKFQNTVTCL